jgi:uncharacterized protein (TIGR02757 family)
MRRELESLYVAFNRQDAVPDPVRFVHRYQDPADREVVALLAASLAFGRVASVLQSIERALAPMGPSPAQFIRTTTARECLQAYETFVHRWTRGPDLAALVIVLGAMLDAGGIEAFLVRDYDPSAPDLTQAIESFSRRARAVDVRAVYGRRKADSGIGYFFPCPSSGSACKRLNLFLRWVVRRDAVDPGIWTVVRPAQLIVPLDTHVIRVGRCLGLTKYRNPGWRMAADITASLRRIDPDDPVRFDFSLCHLGMTKACGYGTALGSAKCPLRGHCKPVMQA